ncbi:MAG TPA: PEP-CTERM sorting domain-containing protein [Gemmataceae bacterium]|nr:PEP-CTERM sorting domain-containing protein [Gemmataceae bacterium]
MLSPHYFSRLSLTLVALAGLTSAARGGFVVIPQANAAYLASTFAFDIPSSGPAIQSLVANDLTITFSAPMTPVATATLYSQQQSSRGLTFSEPVGTFGLMMNPNFTLFSTVSMTAKFFNGATLLGTISQNVSQHSPKLFAATDTDTPFTSVQLSTVSSAEGFLISNVRAEIATPEPASLVLFSLGLIGVIGYGRRRGGIAGSR